MAKKNNNNLYLIMFVVAITAFFYGGSQGWFKSSIDIENNYPEASQDIMIQLEKPPTITEVCTLAITPPAVFSGDSVTGIIQDGANRRCDVYAIGEHEGTDTWRLIYTGMTDNIGRLSQTQNIELSGTFRFKALCGSCGTNEVTLIVNPLPTQTCEEKATDGGYFFKDMVYTPFDCNKVAIDECEKKGLAALSYNLDRSYCCMYKCQTNPSIICTDTDGGQIYGVTGSCTDATMTGVTDNCNNAVMLKEMFCNSNTCVSQLYYCPAGTTCSAGACRPNGPLDSDGDGFSDVDEIATGTDPDNPDSYPGGPLEACAIKCKNIDYAGASYKPGSNNNACQSYAYETCFSVHGLQYEASTYSTPCCCFDCVGW